MKKVCTNCSLPKHPSAFNESNDCCIKCTNRGWTNDLSDDSLNTTRQAARNSQLKYKFGITLEYYNQMITDQKNCCAICRNPFIGSWYDRTAPVVDHCHTTNEVRGILCQSCNKGIGHFRNDAQSLINAAKYLAIFQ